MMEKMPVSIANDAQRIVDEIVSSKSPSVLTSKEAAWILSLASLVRDLARDLDTLAKTVSDDSN